MTVKYHKLGKRTNQFPKINVSEQVYYNCMAKEIKILGACCDKCSRLYEITIEAVRATGIDAEVSKVSDISEIIAFGVMTTPALVIDGHVVIMGRVPSPDEIKTLIAESP